jgi:hypothetical protein
VVAQAKRIAPVFNLGRKHRGLGDKFNTSPLPSDAILTREDALGLDCSCTPNGTVANAHAGLPSTAGLLELDRLPFERPLG